MTTERQLTPQQIEEELLKENAKELESAVSEYFSSKEDISCCNNPEHGLYMMKEDKQQAEDSLELIFEKQKELAAYYSEKQPDSYYHHGPHRYPNEKIVLGMLAIEDEFAELRKVIPWKWWKTKNPDGTYYNDSLEDTDYDKNFLTSEDKATQQQLIQNTLQEYIQKEVIDIGHFYIQMCIDAGLDAKKLVELYLEKHSENKRRQDSGY